MEIHITLRSPPASLPRIEDAITAIDSSAVVDIDPAGLLLRVSTSLARTELLSLLSGVGITPPAQDVMQLPSTCCGGCSG